MKYLFQQSRHKARLKAFISVDGTNPARVVNAGTGVKRYRVTVRGPEDIVTAISDALTRRMPSGG